MTTQNEGDVLRPTAADAAAAGIAVAPANLSDVPRPAIARDHPIAMAVDSYLQLLRDVADCVKTYVVQSLNDKVTEIENYEAKHKFLQELFERRKSANEVPTIADMTRVREFVNLSHRMRHSLVPKVLLSSLYVAMFSALDTLIAALIRCLFHEKQDLFGTIDRSLSLDEIVRRGSIDAVKEALLEQEIDAVRRKSYVEQFEYMERVFGLSLRQFDNWPSFVEAGQRRNLYVHCDGIVTEQYLEICRKYKVELPADTRVGTRFHLDAEHMFKTIGLMGRIGVMLSHTLWRKVLPEQVETADAHLKDIVYEALQRERLKFAIAMGRFALSPMISKTSSDITKKVATVNLAIALNFDGAKDEAIKLLDAVDFSAAIPEFNLANAVLRERYEEAAEIMRAIGREGTMLGEFSYHDWPLFREFRTSPHFLTTYEEIYGASFTSRVATAVEKEAVVTAAQIEGRQEEYAARRHDLEAGVKESAADPAELKTKDASAE